ncbi:MAG: radical SAM protein [Acidobacteria bacterium]|nr:radical SAM protein [Acidobacteriota bacterium]
MFFSAHAMRSLIKGVVFKRNPLYVQFYVTARCNLTCKQCNIIYANADVREASLEEVDRIAANLKAIGTAIVLLTGGEPFIRRDIAEIVGSFERRGIHVRTQTNGLATREQLAGAVKAGARDISISLDSLSPSKQDFLNGSYNRSWMKALETIALVSEIFPPKHSFASFGTVLSPHNIGEIPNIIRFASAIGWYVSLVPAHISRPSQLFNFRSFDREMEFHSELFTLVDKVLEECRQLKRDGFTLYDSEEYIRNIGLFIKGRPVQWRRRNNGMCDSPSLYFAIRPNGDLKVCCDHILRKSIPVWHDDFPKWFRDGTVHEAVHPYVRDCPGCMYGSFPEISISAHYPLELLKRGRVFSGTSLKKPWPLTVDQVVAIAERVAAEHPVDDRVGQPYLQDLPSHREATIAYREAAVAERR